MSGNGSGQNGTKDEIKRRLERLADLYGEVPLVSRVLSEDPGLFLPYSDLSKRLLMEPKHLSVKEMELVAVAASAALGSEHCLNVHLPQALKAGATREEIMETVMVATFMSMTKGQSIALRKLAEQK
ncbi:MAG: carboxymuconolactone decarboxylase family protein [Methanomassiliicoccus sp.]|nr:carboxymuconolactone decarboxylase family protein [Methanomassiliicoccus sp.]